MKKLVPHAPSFASDERGAITTYSLFTFAAMAIVGGIALDVSHAVQMRTHLQIAADAAAHAALVVRDTEPEETARTVALAVAAMNMPPNVQGNGVVLRDEDIEFGTWDSDTLTFTPDPPGVDSRDAVRVRTQRMEANGNPVQTFLLRLVGRDFWNLDRDAVFVAYENPCLMQGFVAELEVDLQSNNAYSDGFCIHSNRYVSLNSNNFFEPGTVVSMPDLADLDLPQSGFETNEGLEAALRYGKFNIKILNDLETTSTQTGLIDRLRVPTSDVQPGYIDGVSPVRSLTVVNGNPRSDTEVKNLEQANLVPGSVHVLDCPTTGGQVNVKSDTLFNNIVLVTNCSLKFEAGVALENTVIATTSTDVRSINAPSGLRVGANDDCAPGGESQIITLGGMDVASDLQLYGAQIIAKRDISFSANADGIEGVAMVSGGVISGTSNMNMGFCDEGVENTFQARYFRLVQ